MNQVVKDFYTEYEKELKEQDFPDEILEEFTMESCIGSSEDGATYLFSQNATGKKCVVKVRSKLQKYRVDIEENVFQRLQEADSSAGQNNGKWHRLLKRIDTEENCFLVREYVEGENLEDYHRRKQELTEAEIAEIGMAVCEQLKELHEMPAPLIHRDIKPQNIVITPEREIRLIDFDSVRSYNEGKERDTYFLGTVQTAAPEQYGFEQTDPRTDLYGLGKTLLYLACGSYDDGDLEKTHYSSRLKRIIRKSVSLLKKERFKSASSMYEQLDKCRRGVLYKKPRIIFGGVVAALVVIGAFLGGTQYRQMREARVVHFDSQMLEMAVRDALGFDDERSITYADLENVYELRVIGSTLFSAQAQYRYQFSDCPDYNYEEAYLEKGDIWDISLLAQMPNLKSVYLCNQNITDITPLKNLDLVVLALSGNYIEDFSVVSDMTSLRSLYVGNNPLHDLSFLEGNTSLELLNMGSTSVTSLKPLESTKIAELWIMGCEVLDSSYASFPKMEKLSRLYTFSFSEEQVKALNGCKELSELWLWGESGVTNLECLSGVDGLRLLVLGNQFVSLDGIGNLNGLEQLVLGANITEIEAIADMEDLVRLNMTDCGLRIKDYAPIAQHPGLEELYCTQEQMEAILKDWPDITVKFTYF